ncbi:MAG: hypothetical protein IPL53_07500 [Ignavibacteria bacterium]|nr:hypothetical protein [Ignavibacteria bacterium]
MTPGFNREPIAVALIIALGGPVIIETIQLFIKEYFETKRTGLELSTQSSKNEQVHKENLLKISLRSKSGWETKSGEEFIKMDLK